MGWFDRRDYMLCHPGTLDSVITHCYAFGFRDNIGRPTIHYVKLKILTNNIFSNVSQWVSIALKLRPCIRGRMKISHVVLLRYWPSRVGANDPSRIFKHHRNMSMSNSVISIYHLRDYFRRILCSYATFMRKMEIWVYITVLNCNTIDYFVIK